MTYLPYNQIRLSDDTCTDLAHDTARAGEERSIAIRAFARACARRLQDFQHRVSSAPLFGGPGGSGSSGLPA